MALMLSALLQSYRTLSLIKKVATLRSRVMRSIVILLFGSGPILALKVISSGRYVVARKNASNFTQYYYGTGTTWTSMATSASTNGGKARHATFNLDGNDKVIFVDGTNFPAVYNTSGNTFDFFKNDGSGDTYDIGTNDPSGAENVAIFKNTAFYSKGNTFTLQHLLLCMILVLLMVQVVST